MDLTLPKIDKKIIEKNLIIKRLHFKFIKDKQKNCLACLRLLRRKTNIFLILEDLKGKTIICRTSGTAGITGLKRFKRVPQAVDAIFNVVYPHMKVYSINRVNIIINTRINGCYYALIRQLEFYGIKVNKFLVRRRIAFNGCRGRKLRRV